LKHEGTLLKNLFQPSLLHSPYFQSLVTFHMSTTEYF
jgi:hypothetical protein